MKMDQRKMDDFTEKEFKKVRGIVLQLLKTDNRCRNDDLYLDYCVQKYVNRASVLNEVKITFDQFKSLMVVNHETIRRTRQSIQHNGMYLPTDPEIAYRRGMRQDSITEMAREGEI